MSIRIPHHFVACVLPLANGRFVRLCFVLVLWLPLLIVLAIIFVVVVVVAVVAFVRPLLLCIYLCARTQFAGEKKGMEMK